LAANQVQSSQNAAMQAYVAATHRDGAS
jgi:hypothetical protein